MGRVIPVALGLVVMRFCACGGELALEGLAEADGASATAERPPHAPTDATLVPVPPDSTTEPHARAEASVDASSAPAVLEAGDPQDASPPGDASDGATAFDADLGDGACLPYYERCNGYVFERCDGTGQWYHPAGYKLCCKDPRFATHDPSTAPWVSDSKTGKAWWPYTFDAPLRSEALSQCPTRFAGGRLPTTAELLDIVLMTPMEYGQRICAPTTDWNFVSSGREYWTTDGCVSLLTGLYVGPSCHADAGYGNPPGTTCIRD